MKSVHCYRTYCKVHCIKYLFKSWDTPTINVQSSSLSLPEIMFSSDGTSFYSVLLSDEVISSPVGNMSSSTATLAGINGSWNHMGRSHWPIYITGVCRYLTPQQPCWCKPPALSGPLQLRVCLSSISEYNRW